MKSHKIRTYHYLFPESCPTTAKEYLEHNSAKTVENCPFPMKLQVRGPIPKEVIRYRTRAKAKRKQKAHGGGLLRTMTRTYRRRKQRKAGSVVVRYAAVRVPGEGWKSTDD